MTYLEAAAADDDIKLYLSSSAISFLIHIVAYGIMDIWNLNLIVTQLYCNYIV